MRVIIAGSRIIRDYVAVEKAVKESGFEITEVISGAANGVDRLGERYAKEHGIPIRRFIPEWHVYGRCAGHLRNEDMALNADALIAVWDGKSRGTKSMIDIAKCYNLKVFVTILHTQTTHE